MKKSTPGRKRPMEFLAYVISTLTLRRKPLHRIRIDDRTREAVIERDGLRCRYCGKQLTALTAEVDHIVPLKKGGTSDPANLATTCEQCNIAKADRFVEAITPPGALGLARLWIKAFRHSPRITIAISTICLCLGAGLAAILDQYDAAQRDAIGAETASYQAQIQHLNQVEKDIANLRQFVVSQRKIIEQSDRAITALRAEEAKLQPLVRGNRTAVEALFAAQEERNRATATRERWIGLAIGVAGSILASVILLILRYFFRKCWGDSN